LYSQTPNGVVESPELSGGDVTAMPRFQERNAIESTLR
jgi:hypothetical protein